MLHISITRIAFIVGLRSRQTGGSVVFWGVRTPTTKHPQWLRCSNALSDPASGLTPYESEHLRYQTFCKRAHKGLISIAISANHH